MMEQNLKNSIPVVFATDDNYVPYLSVAIQSIIENCTSPIAIYVFHVGLKAELTFFLKQQVFSYDHINLSFVDCKNEVSLLNLDSGAVKHLTSISWLRLLIPYILPQYNKAIYLDVDVLVLKDLSLLFHIDLGANLIAAVRDTFIVSWNNQNCVKKDLKSPENYYNSGVLVFNCLAFRYTFSRDELMQKAYRSNYYYGDQDFLNLLTDENTLVISSQWNMQKGWLSKNTPDWLNKEYAHAQANPYIVHFIHKPMKETVLSELSRLFLDYASRVKVPLVLPLFINAHKSGKFIYENNIRDYLLHLINRNSEKIDLKFLIKCVIMVLKSKFKIYYKK